MKKLYSLFLTLLLIVISAQTTITISSNDVKFITKFPANSYSNPAPVYLYTWCNTSDNSQGVFKELTGNWPGTLMVGPDNNGNYTLSMNLASFYAEGATVNEINYIYNNGSGGGTNQSPDLKVSSDATGWFPVTINTLNVSDVSKKSKYQIVDGKLFPTKKGNLDIIIYDFSGKVVKTVKANANGNPIDLSVQNRGYYLVKVSDGTYTEVVKFSK